MQQLNNLLRGTTFFQHAGVSIVYVFMPILAQSLTSNILEVGLTIASFFFAQIVSSLYFGRISDKTGSRLIFIRLGFLSCAIMFGLHYIADNSFYLILVRMGAGVASGMIVPVILAYTYESGKDKSKIASVISFHALGWLVGIVAAGIAPKCEAQVAYAIGVAEPVGLFVTTYGTSKVKLSDGELGKKIGKIFDLRPYAIEQRFKLRTPIYAETAAYGHMGREPKIVEKVFNKGKLRLKVELFPWEKLDYVDKIKAAFKL